jgi:hypothetical protein
MKLCCTYTVKDESRRELCLPILDGGPLAQVQRERQALELVRRTTFWARHHQRNELLHFPTAWVSPCHIERSGDSGQPS